MKLECLINVHNQETNALKRLKTGCFERPENIQKERFQNIRKTFLECIFVIAGLLHLMPFSCAASYNYHDQLIILMLFQSLLLTHD